jgi:putative glycosyltransferase (TIGR04372 family)
LSYQTLLAGFYANIVAGFVADIDNVQSAPMLLRDLWRHVRAGNPLRHLALPTTQQDQASEFLDGIGVAPGEHFVTLHMREASYLSSHRYHGFRNMTPENYAPAIQHLLDQGIWVFRLGDKDSTPLGFDHPRFVDLPFRDDYEDYMDVVLLAEAWFAICCSSGPLGPAIAFGTPVLLVNGILEQQTFFNPRDVIQFKRYIDDVSETPIPYSAILERGLCGISESKQLEERRVHLEENSPDEILAAVREMIARLEDAFTPNPETDKRFRATTEAFATLLETGDRGPEHLEPVDQSFGLALPWTTLCHAYCEANPWFLGTSD